MGIGQRLGAIVGGLFSKKIVKPEWIHTVSTSLSFERSKEIADLFNSACIRYNIKDFTEVDEFLANLFQESLEFNHKTENMNYRAATLVKVWPSRFPNLAAAEPYAHNPEKLANKVYGGRMGNNMSGDGWRYRGGGFIGLTGKDTYQRYADYIKKPVGETADLVRSTDYYALDSAFWFFCVLKDLEDEGERNDFIGIVKSINGGTIGYKDRQFYYDRIKNLR